MSGSAAHGGHILLDYIGYAPPVDNDGDWMLQVLRDMVVDLPDTCFPDAVAQFDGDGSPPGFAAVVLIDESHVSAHCYSDRGLLAIDIFTCGGNDPAPLADDIHEALQSAVPGLVLSGREHIDRLSALE